jgi:hypothetical protein
MCGLWRDTFQIKIVFHERCEEMINKTFVFELDGIRVRGMKKYKKEPKKEQVISDMKEWFFNNYHMWFAVDENGIETNLEDYFE